MKDEKDGDLKETLKCQVSIYISRVCRKEFVDTWSPKSYNFSAMLIKTVMINVNAF
jgi:hypothetical protein